MTARLPVVGVMGSGSADGGRPAVELGRSLASLPVHLLTGGGGGVMTSVSRAFAEVPARRGLVLGVLPGDPGRGGAAPDGYPNQWVEVMVRTHLPARGEQGDDALSRNHINVLSSDVVIALAGGAGTRSEVELAARYGTPVAWFLPDAADDPAGDVPVLHALPEVMRFVRHHLGLA
jgi:uncharacterized protein (TIGR00725 family)